jgi:hypothetical protein
MPPAARLGAAPPPAPPAAARRPPSGRAAARRRPPPQQRRRAALALGADGASPSSSSDATPPAWDAAAAARAAAKVAAARAARASPPPAPLAETRRIAETAVLAALAGTLYTVSTLLRLEGYLGYALPLPMVLATLRHGGGAGARALGAAALLLSLLVGPLRAAAFALVHGLPALALGAAWARRAPWAVSVPAGAAARVAGCVLRLGRARARLAPSPDSSHPPPAHPPATHPRAATPPTSRSPRRPRARTCWR